MFFNHLIVASAGLAALATSSATPKLIDVPAYDLGTPLGKSAVADASSLFCNLTPAKLCKLSDAVGAYNYLYGLGEGGDDCAMTDEFSAETGIQLSIFGTASIVMSTTKPGNISVPCATVATLLDKILVNCQTGNGQRVKGLIHVPAGDYTSDDFTPDDHTVSISVVHM